MALQRSSLTLSLRLSSLWRNMDRSVNITHQSGTFCRCDGVSHKHSTKSEFHYRTKLSCENHDCRPSHFWTRSPNMRCAWWVIRFQILRKPVSTTTKLFVKWLGKSSILANDSEWTHSGVLRYSVPQQQQRLWCILYLLELMWCETDLCLLKVLTLLGKYVAHVLHTARDA